MKKFFAFAVMAVAVAPFGQCQTLRKLTSETGSVGWELKLEDRPYLGYHQSEIHPSVIPKVTVPDYGHAFGKTYLPPSFYKSPKTYYEKPGYTAITKTADPVSLGYYEKDGYGALSKSAHTLGLNYYEKPGYVSIPKTTDTIGLVHKTYQEPKYHPEPHSTIHAHSFYDAPISTTVRPTVYKTANVAPKIHKTEYSGVPNYHVQNYDKVRTMGGYNPHYQYDDSSDHYYHH